MLKKRLIFSLLYENKTFHLSRNFRLQKIGNLEWLKKNYNFSLMTKSVDEIVLLNVSRNEKKINDFLTTIKQFVKNCFIPLSVGGKIDSIDVAKKYINSGADKLIINTNLFNMPLINELAHVFGKQCLIGSIDYKVNDFGEIEIFQENGTKKNVNNFSLIINKINKLPIGELMLNSIDQDGTGQGFNFDILKKIPNKFCKPIIFLGGAGNHSHLLSAFQKKKIDAVATANLLNFVGDGLQDARRYIINSGIDLANWN